MSLSRHRNVTHGVNRCFPLANFFSTDPCPFLLDIWLKLLPFVPTSGSCPGRRFSGRVPIVQATSHGQPSQPNANQPLVSHRQIAKPFSVLFPGFANGLCSRRLFLAKPFPLHVCRLLSPGRTVLPVRSMSSFSCTPAPPLAFIHGTYDPAAWPVKLPRPLSRGSLRPFA